MKILLLEPDRPLGQTYASALEQAGHTVRHIGNAQQAISTLDHGLPDLIILELQLAAHNGIEFLYELRSYTDWQTLPVIVLSIVPPYELGLSHKLTQQLGIAGCLYKPHTRLADLVRYISQLQTAQAA
jgi:CheY-like chemotaxis protein